VVSHNLLVFIVLCAFLLIHNHFHRHQVFFILIYQDVAVAILGHGTVVAPDRCAGILPADSDDLSVASLGVRLAIGDLAEVLAIRQFAAWGTFIVKGLSRHNKQQA